MGSGHDCSPPPGRSGLDLVSWSSPDPGPSRLESGGRFSPSPSGAGDDDRSSTVDSLDMDQDDTFRAVLRLIWEFHTLEEPASVAPNRCNTSLALVYVLQSELSLSLHLPTSPLLRSLLEDTNSALSKFVKDQTVHGFFPVPGRRHRRYYRTSSSSFPGPFSVPLGLALITLERVSESRKCFVSLSYSQVSSLEAMLSSVCEITSWLDWWLSTCGSFQEHLTDEAHGNFEWLMLCGSRALEFLGGQGVTALGNLVLSRRDSLLLDVKSTVPAEEVARLRYAALPLSASLFPTPLLESALDTMRAASNDTLVQKTRHPQKIPRKSSVALVKAASSSASSADRGGTPPLVPRSQKPVQMASSSSTPQQGRKRKGRKGKTPFSSTSGRSGGN